MGRLGEAGPLGTLPWLNHRKKTLAGDMVLAVFSAKSALILWSSELKLQLTGVSNSGITLIPRSLAYSRILDTFSLL